MYHLRVPKTEADFKNYYQFRWEMLRKPSINRPALEKTVMIPLLIIR